MDVIQNEQEELREEEELSKKPSKEEVRAKVVEKYGLDEEDHEALIDSLTEDKLAEYEAKGKLIAQKRKWREEAKKPKEVPPIREKSNAIDPDELLKKAEEVVEQRFEKRDLDSLELPDEIKSEVQKIAKAQGISIRQAASDPYILFKKEQYEKEQKTNEAAISRNNKTAATQTFDPANPPKLDLTLDPNSAEGKAAVAKYQKDMAEWTAKAKQQG